MSNKKRIRKLLLKKYKPSKKFYLSNGELIFLYGRRVGIQFINNTLKEEYLNNLRNYSKTDFEKEYLSNPIIANHQEIVDKMSKICIQAANASKMLGKTLIMLNNKFELAN